MNEESMNESVLKKLVLTLVKSFLLNYELSNVCIPKI